MYLLSTIGVFFIWHYINIDIFNECCLKRSTGKFVDLCGIVVYCIHFRNSVYVNKYINHHLK